VQPAPLLRIENLATEFRSGGGSIRAVDGVSLNVARGRTLGIVGESGCGKSVLSLSVMRLLAANGHIAAGRVLLEDTDLATLPASAMRTIRGGRIAMIFQEPMTSLNPVHTVGFQIVEALRVHTTHPAAELRERAIAALRRVRIPAPERRFDEYPHQLSGGMRQRVMIAMALSCEPALLIADEPTTALDVTVQAEILDLLRALQAETGMAMILITHDLGVVAEMAHEVAVMYAGRVVEQAPVETLFADPQHPYTLGLLSSIPRLDGEAATLPAIAGRVPAPHTVVPGCRFHPRCVFAADPCRRDPPALRDLGPGHSVACHLAPVELHAAA
jgi:peptide/nickel transport system ATP-binding protein/oligopeptide transport system ATP-binding protein